MLLISSVQCTKKRLQLYLKILLIVSVIGIYFVVLLRESFAAWESSSLSASAPISAAAAAAAKNGIKTGNHLGNNEVGKTKINYFPSKNPNTQQTNKQTIIIIWWKWLMIFLSLSKYAICILD